MNKEEKIIDKLKELGYIQNIFVNYIFKKRFNDYCIFHIELETDEDYKNARGLIRKAYIESNFIIHEQRIIDEIQKGFNVLQEELKNLGE